jgi:hypothetical protein
MPRLSQRVQLCTWSPINFGDLSPYLTYVQSWIGVRRLLHPDFCKVCRSSFKDCHVCNVSDIDKVSHGSVRGSSLSLIWAQISHRFHHVGVSKGVQNVLYDWMIWNIIIECQRFSSLISRCLCTHGASSCFSIGQKRRDKKESTKTFFITSVFLKPKRKPNLAEWSLFWFFVSRATF